MYMYVMDAGDCGYCNKLLEGLCVAKVFLILKLNYGVSLPIFFFFFFAVLRSEGYYPVVCIGGNGLRKEEDYKRNLPILS